MILKNVKTIEPDSILAKAIYDKNSRLLLNKGAILGKNQIELLKRFDIQGVYVEPRNEECVNDMNVEQGINKSNFTEITLLIEFGVSNSELSTMSPVRRLEAFLNALNHFSGHLVIHTSFKGEGLHNVGKFKHPVPSNKVAPFRQVVRVMNVSILIYHPDDQSGKIPNPKEVYWFEYKNALFNIQIESVKNKIQESTNVGELISL